MGNKDNPRRQNHGQYIAGGIGALFILLGGYGYHQKDELIQKKDVLIKEHEQMLVEQGSLIDRQNKQMANQNQTIKDLKVKVVTLDEQFTKQQANSTTMKETYETKIQGLNSELTNLKKIKAEQSKITARAVSAPLPKPNTTRKTTTKRTLSSRGEAPKGKTLTVSSTGYIAMCKEGCTGITATGYNLKANPHAKVIAVDPKVIPLGTKVYVPGYGYAVAADTGGAIDGHKIDLHFPTTKEALDWGKRSVEIRILK